MYDFIDYFQRDGPSTLERDKFLEIVNTIFKDFNQLERDALVFQVNKNFYSKFIIFGAVFR